MSASKMPVVSYWKPKTTQEKKTPRDLDPPERGTVSEILICLGSTGSTGSTFFAREAAEVAPAPVCFAGWPPQRPSSKRRDSCESVRRPRANGVASNASLSLQPFTSALGALAAARERHFPLDSAMQILSVLFLQTCISVGSTLRSEH